MEELLELLCFEKDEVAKEMPRIEKAFEKLSITDRDIAVAMDRLHKYYEIELLGFRKIMGIFIREMVNLTLAKGEKRKLIYNSLPSVSAAIGEAAQVADPSVYTGFPTVLFLMIYDALFKKLVPLQERAEQEALSVTEAHCGCNMAKIGSMLKGLIPLPDLQLSWGIYCDEAAKVDDYMQVEWNVPTLTPNRVQDVNFDEDHPQREIDYFAEELRKTVAGVSAVIEREITDEMLWPSIIEGGMLLQSTKELLSLTIFSDPCPISLTTIWHIYMMYILSLSGENRGRAKAAIDIILQEVRGRVERGEGYYAKGAPHIAIFLPSFVDPSLDLLMKDLGLAAVLAEPMWWYPDAGLSPDLGVEDDMEPYSILAKALLVTNVVASFHIRMAMIRKAVQRFDIDGFLGIFPYSCRPFASDALMLKDVIKKTMDIPVTILEGDWWDDRRYSSEVLRTRIESFAEMCKIYKMRKDLKAA